jgi:hypothetical protein
MTRRKALTIPSRKSFLLDPSDFCTTTSSRRKRRPQDGKEVDTHNVESLLMLETK